MFKFKLRKMHTELFSDLQTRIGAMKCAHGHEAPIRFVNLSPSANRKFLCNDCVQEGNLSKALSVKDLAEYFEILKKESAQKIKVDPSLLNETDTAIAVVNKLKDDVNTSLKDIKNTVGKHYKHFMEEMHKSALKGSTRIYCKIDHETRRSYDELSSIETNLNLYKTGGSLQIVNDVLDQALNYARNRTDADNALFDLLCGLNVKETILNTHSRLSQFAQKYFPRKKTAIEGVKEALLRRLNKERALCNAFFDERMKMVQGLLAMIAPDNMPDVGVAQNNNRDNSPIGRRKNRGLMRNAKKHFGEDEVRGSTRDGRLGKRRMSTETYDPKASFERAFGQEVNTNSIDKQFNSFSVSVATSKSNRLSELVDPKKLISECMIPSINVNSSAREQEDPRRFRKDAKESLARTGRNKSQRSGQNTEMSNELRKENNRSYKDLFTPGGFIPAHETDPFFNKLSAPSKKFPMSLFKEKSNRSINTKGTELPEADLIKSLKENLIQIQRAQLIQKETVKPAPLAVQPTTAPNINSAMAAEKPVDVQLPTKPFRVADKENSRDPRIKMRMEQRKHLQPLSQEPDQVPSFIQPSKLISNAL